MFVTMGAHESLLPDNCDATPLAQSPVDAVRDVESVNAREADHSRIDAAQIEALAEAKSGLSTWPDQIRGLYRQEVTRRIEKDQQFLLLLGLLVCIATLLIDFAVNPAMIKEGAILRVLAVAPITFLGLLAASRNWKSVAAFCVGASLIAFAAVIVHLSLHLPPEGSARYLAAAALLMGFANFSLPFSLRGLMLFNVAYIVAAYTTDVVGGHEHLFETLDFLVMLVIISVATIVLAHRIEQLRQNNFLLTLHARTTSHDLTQANAQLRELSYRDPLTGLPNRRFFKRLFTELRDENAAAQKGASADRLAMMMIDLDHFKAFNDTHGHVAGDEALRIVGHELAAMMERMDGIAARYGGEEFVAAVCVASQADAERVAEEVRGMIAALLVPIWPTGKSVVTASVGAAIAPAGMTAEREMLIAHADAALYEAKRSGRNQIKAIEAGHNGAIRRAEAAE